MAHPCIAIIREAGGELITDEQANELIEAIVERTRNTQNAQLVSTEEAVRQVTAQMIEENKLHGVIQKRNALLTIRAQRKMSEVAHRFKTLGEGMNAFINGSRKRIPGARLSVDSQLVALRNGYVGELLAQLEEADLVREFQTNELDHEVFQELWNFSNPSNQNPSGSPRAKAMARIIRELQHKMVARENRAGGFIHMRDDYVMTQTHDPVLIRKAGGMGFKEGSNEASYQVWREFILPLLNHETTFQGADIDKFLRGVHEGILTGVHGKSGISSMAEFQGTGSLAKKVSHKRVLHFKDADASYKYNQRFGAKNLRDGIMNDIRRAAHATALMENFGPNPEMSYNRMIRKLKEEARTLPNDVAQMKSLENEWLQGSFDQILGKYDMPSNPTVHTITRGLQTWATLSKLGAVTLSAIPDKAFFQMAGSFQGISNMRLLAEQFRLFAPRSKAETRQMHLMGAAIDGFLGSVASRFTSMDNTAGKMFSLQQKLFKLNGMNWWNDVHKGAFAQLEAAHLGTHAKFEMGQLPVELRNSLGLYGITPDEWNAIRGTMFTAENGHRYVTPDQLRNIPEATIDDLITKTGGVVSENNRLRMRDNVETKLRAFIVDQVDDAVVTPGNRERLITNMNTQAGTIKGMAARLLMHFKSFPISVWERIFKRELLGHGEFSGIARLMNKGNFRIAQLIAMTTIGGYVSMTIKDALKGRTPRRIIDEDGTLSWRVLNDAMLRGGGLGIYGDFLFTEYDRSYRNFLNVATGPVIGQIPEVAATITDLRTGKPVMKSAEKLILGNTPYINLFYIRPALDYIILWNLQEMLSPGYARRMERNVEERNNQGFFIRPTEVVR